MISNLFEGHLFKIAVSVSDFAPGFAKIDDVPVKGAPKVVDLRRKGFDHLGSDQRIRAVARGTQPDRGGAGRGGAPRKRGCPQLLWLCLLFSRVARREGFEKGDRKRGATALRARLVRDEKGQAARGPSPGERQHA